MTFKIYSKHPSLSWQYRKICTLTRKQEPTSFGSYDSVCCEAVHGAEFNMLIYILFANFLVSCGSVRPRARGEFPTSQGSHTPHLLEGDIAVSEHHLVAGTVQEAFLANQAQLWPQGLISFRFETFEWEGRVEPVFLDSQMANITTALDNVMQEVPCIKFRQVG